MILVFSPLVAEEIAVDAAVVELRETISKVVDARALASEETSGWAAQKASMAALLELHRRELALLDEELEKAGQSAGGFDEKRREVIEEVAELRVAKIGAAEVVAAQRDRALAIVRKFPKPLADETEVERVALENWKVGDEPRDGLQAILGMITRAEQFNRRITRSREERDGREAEVIYLGLARAYYIDRSGNAGVGVVGPDGWLWSARPEIFGEVEKAIAELEKKRPPELVELPIKVGEVRK